MDSKPEFPGNLQTALGVWLIFSPWSGIENWPAPTARPRRLHSLRLLRRSPSELEITGRGGLGDVHVRVILVESSATTIRCTTTLTPRSTLLLGDMPHDLCVLDGRLEPWSGQARLMTCQTGNTAPQLFFQVASRPGATVFYFQNLTALTDFFSRTEAKAAGCVSVR
jgi:hypothetical protein